MSDPISDDQDDLDRTDRLPVLQVGDSADEFPAFDSTATVVIDPAVHPRVAELESALAARDGELAEMRERLRQRAEVGAELEARVERLRAELRAQEQQASELRDAASRLAAAEQARAVLDAELQQHLVEASALSAALDEAQQERQRLEAERQAERAAFQEDSRRLGIEAAQLRAEIDTRVSALTELEGRCAHLDAELLAVRARLETDLKRARERLEAEAVGLRAELEAEREAHRTLRDAQSLLERDKLQQAARQGDEVARVQLVVERLAGELTDARNTARALERDLATARSESARIAAMRAGLERALRDRDLQIETLLERLRHREARQRIAGDVKSSARAESQRALEEIRLPDRLAAIEAALAARSTATNEDESRLAALLQQFVKAREEFAAAADAAARAAVEAAATHANAMAAQAAAAADARALAEAQARDKAIAGAGPSADSAAAAQAGMGGSRYLTRIDDESGIVYILAAPRIVVGRGKSADLLVPESYVSACHAVLRLGPDLTLVEDAGSTNGVFVNGRRVQREVLRDGDVVSFGRARFRFHSRGLITAGS